MRSTLLLMMLLATASLAGCDEPTKDISWVKPIYPTGTDLTVISRQLMDQITIHNETGERLDLWEAPSASPKARPETPGLS